MRIHPLLISALLLCVAVSTAAQSFDSLKKKTPSAYNETLNTLLNKDDVQGMKAFLVANPSAVNQASSSESRQGEGKKLIVSTIPLLYDAVNKTLQGTCSTGMCWEIVNAGGDLNSAYEGKTPVYLILDFIATHPKDECGTAEQLLIILSSKSNFDANLRYRSLLPPLAYLIRENRHYLGKFDKDYISDVVFQLLIDKGASVNTYDDEGNSLMAFAIDTKNEWLQTYFIEQGINLSKKNKGGDDALYKAINSGQLTVIKQILKASEFDLNQYTLQNDPASFKQYEDVYNYIAEVCSDKANSYTEIMHFMQKFNDKSDLTWAKLTAIDHQTYQRVSVEKAKYRETIPQYNHYLELFPAGFHAGEAKARIQTLMGLMEKEEIDDINKYVKISNDDIYFAKGDGLSFIDWFASGSQDLKNLNVFVLGKITNTGKLPKRIKATVSLFIDTEIKVVLLFIPSTSRSRKAEKKEWFLDLQPGETEFVGSHFKAQESAWGSGNMLIGAGSSTHISKEQPYFIRLEYYEEEIPRSTLQAQNTLINTLREHGNVAVKEGYESRYQEAQAEQRAASARKENERKLEDQVAQAQREYISNLDPDEIEIPKYTVGEWSHSALQITGDEYLDVDFKDDEKTRGAIYRYNDTRTYFIATPLLQFNLNYKTENDAIAALYVYVKYKKERKTGQK